MPDPQDSRGVGTLISDLVEQTTSLVQTEIRLMRAEISDKFRTAVGGLTEMLAGALLLMVALLVLVQALVVALATWLGAGWASFLVGVVIAIIGIVLVRQGKANLEPSALAPDQTSDQLAKDAAVIKEQFK